MPFSFHGGPNVQALETEWSEYHGCRHSISVNSATSGLYAAVGALGLGFGDEVIVSPYTMSACALAPMIYGAIPVFADVDKDSGCLDPESVRRQITPRTRAVIVVHQFGIPADMTRIMEIAREHNLRVIEDCAQAYGARHRGKPVGTFGDVGVFSLNVNKAIQSGEGGVCITSSSDVAYRLKLIRNHGEAVVEAAGLQNITNLLGFNYRMTEVTAAIARSQLRKLSRLNRHRLKLVSQFIQSLEKVEWLEVLSRPSNSCDCDADPSCCLPTYYLVPMRIKPIGNSLPSREHFQLAMTEEGVIMNAGYVKPLYLQPIYQTKVAFKNGYPFSAPENAQTITNYQLGSCANAEEFHFRTLLLSEHMRWPHRSRDIRDISSAVLKYDDWLRRGKQITSSSALSSSSLDQ